MAYSDEQIISQLAEIVELLKSIDSRLNQNKAAGSNDYGKKSQELKKYPFQYCDEKVASELTGLSRHWFARMRWAGSGPAYSKLGSSKGSGVRYKIEDLIDWFENNKVRNTAELTATKSKPQSIKSRPKRGR